MASLYKIFALSVVLTFALGSAAFATAGSNDVGEETSLPTISSDKADYAPGETVTLTGTNWQPGESVHLSVTSEGGDPPWSRDADVIADENGKITDQFRLPDYGIPKYNVSATGATSGTATASFTDGNVRASANLPGSDSWTLTKTFYSGSNSCATAPSPSSTQVTLSGTNTDTTAATSTQSVKLVASSASTGGQRFFSQWTGPSGFTSTSGTNCVQGFGGASTRDYVANYVPALNINDVTVTEGNAGTTNAAFTVSLLATSSQQVTVNFATADGTATQPGDYTSTSGPLTFAAGETTKSVTDTVNGDTLNEANETFFVNLSGATNATISDNQGVGTITNDDIINDAPINSVPGAQTTGEDAALVFSGANKISISDPDAGGNPVEEELEVDEGTLTLSGTGGLTFTITINAVNDAPTITLNGPRAVNEGDTESYTYTVTDPDSDGFTLKSGYPRCGKSAELVGTPTETSTGGSFECRFLDGPRKSTVRVQGYDSQGRVSNVATQNLKIANVAPVITLTGPAIAREGSAKVYSFTITDPGEDTFAFAAGYPRCGQGAKLVGENMGANGGGFRCKFVRASAKPTVVVRVRDSDGDLSNVATK